jgi:uncharacterized protein YxjI
MSNTTSAVSLREPLARTEDVALTFREHRRLSVRQRKKWWEVIMNWEMKNSYSVFDEDGKHVLEVKENGSGIVSMLKRVFLGPFRPFTSTVYTNPIPKALMIIRRPFRFIFNEISVESGDGRLLGKVVREWSWIRRIYRIEDAGGAEVGRLFGPFLRPWTFQIKRGEQEVGLLQKRWSGGFKELFTDADNFALDVERIEDPTLRSLCFAATVLIDVVHFERSKNQ